MTAVLAHGGTGGAPPPFTWSHLLTEWSLEPTVLVLLLASAGLYLLGVRKLRRRGDSWSHSRVALWFLGLAAIFVATSSAVEVYDTTLFSVHTVQHLLLQIVAPVPLAFAAPITLALRTLPPRPRRLLLWVLHHRVVRVLTHPLVAFAAFVVSPFVLYYSPLFEATLRIDWVHDLNHLHFLLVGCLFYWIIVGVDPLPNRLPHLARLGLILALAPMHVVLGIPIMLSQTLLAGGFYLEVVRSWGPPALEDQALGGALLWVFGDVTVLLFLPGLLSQWYRGDEREARRTDRQLDRQYGTSPTTRPWWEQPAANSPGPPDQPQRSGPRRGNQHTPAPERAEE